MTKYAGPYAQREAQDRAEATCRARARQLSRSYPIWAVISDVVGVVPSDFFTNPDKYAVHRLTGPLQRVDTEDYYLEITPEIEGLPEGTEPVLGVAVPVTRTGAVIADFRIEEPANPAAPAARALTR